MISVITSNYNCAAYLPDCVTSVLNQSYRNWEHIIIDCGSTDNSRQVLDRLKHPRLSIINESFCGVARARNLAVQRARGEFCAILDADDMALPNRLLLQAALLQKNPDVVAVGGDIKAVCCRNRKWKRWLLPKNKVLRLPCRHEEMMMLLRAALSPIPHSVLTFRKSIFRELSGYDEAMEKSEDFDFILRLGLRGHLAGVPEPLGLLRFGVTDSHSTRHRPKGREALCYVVLSILLQLADAGGKNISRQDIEDRLDKIGNQGVSAMQGHWLWNVLLKHNLHLSRAAGAALLRSFVRSLPALVTCRKQTWWPETNSPESFLAAFQKDEKIMPC